MILPWVVIFCYGLSTAFGTNDQKSRPKDELPICNFIRKRNEMSTGDAGLGGRLATFVCSCSKRTRKFHGSLSAIMEEPLGTVPLHLFMAGKLNFARESNDTWTEFDPGALDSGRLQIELNSCDKIRLKVDIPSLFMTRPGGSGSDVTLLISNSHKVHLNRIQVLPNHEHSIILQNVTGKVQISGNIDCLGCTNISKGEKAASINADSLPTVVKIDANGLSEGLVFDTLTSSAPIMVTIRESEMLMVKRSRFQLVPWPGFYVYNVSTVVIKENYFKDVAPKSLTARTGKHLEIVDNVLKIHNVLDVSSYDHVSIKCNRGDEYELLPVDCPLPADVDGLPYIIPEKKHSAEIIFITFAVLSMGLFWLILISLSLILILAYKKIYGFQDYEDYPPTQIIPLSSYCQDYTFSYMPRNFENQYQPTVSDFLNRDIEDSPKKSSREKKLPGCLKGSSVEPVGIVKFKSGNCNDEDDEYSTSSRLHLAGAVSSTNDWVSVSPASTPSASLSVTRQNPFSNYSVTPIIPFDRIAYQNQSPNNLRQQIANYPINHIDSDVSIIYDPNMIVSQEPFTENPQRRYNWQYTKV